MVRRGMKRSTPANEFVIHTVSSTYAADNGRGISGDQPRGQGVGAAQPAVPAACSPFPSRLRKHVRYPAQPLSSGCF